MHIRQGREEHSMNGKYWAHFGLFALSALVIVGVGTLARQFWLDQSLIGELKVLHSTEQRDTDPIEVRRLVLRGASPNVDAGMCGTPLLLAVGKDDLPLIRLLLERGADP